MGCRGGLPGPKDGHSWAWVGICANPMRIATNRGFGGITGKSANVQRRVFESQIRNAVLARSFARSRLQDCGLTLSVRDLSCIRPGWAALYMRSRQVMSCADNLLAELPFLLGAESAAETKTSSRKGSSFKRKKTPSPLRHQV